MYSIPFPYWHQQNFSPGTSSSQLTFNALYQLDLLLKQQTGPADTAAIIIEPVLGEGGYVPAPPEFLQGLRQVCDQHGIMLIIDEVQSGFCRTGDWFAIEQSGVKPDILLMAKVYFDDLCPTVDLASRFSRVSEMDFLLVESLVAGS